MSSGPDPADGADWAELARYVSGQASTEEGVRIHEWAAADPAHRLVLDQAIAAWAHARRADVSPRTDTVWSALAAHLDIAVPHTPVARPQPWPRRAGGGTKGQRGWWEARAGQRPAPTTAIAIAGMALVAAGVGLVVRRSLISGSRSLTPAVREYATAAGQRLSVRLVDGTQLALAPASRVRLNADYGTRGAPDGSKLRPAGAREVELEGEAYFAVVHDATRPFEVHAGSATITDIGTQFDVRAYRDDRETRVAVAEGHVGLQAGGPGQHPTITTPPRALAAGDVAIIADQTISVTHGADISALIEWTTGGIAFDGAPLGAVVADLSRWYGVRILVPDAALATRHVSLRLASPSLDPLLSGLADAVGARVDRRGGLIVLVPLAANQAH